MKKILRLPSLALFCILLLSFAAGSGESPGGAISKQGFIYNKINISNNWSVAPLLADLGQPDSIFTGYNKLYIYKKKGIVVFEKMNGTSPSGIISEVQFFIDRNVGENAYNLTDNYTGTLKAGKLNLTPELSSTIAKSKLKKWHITDSYAENSYRFYNYGVYMYLQFNTDETRLMKVSIGKSSK